MAIELSNVTFTEQDDIVPESGVKERIVNTGITNTLAGNDTITGTYVYDPSPGNDRSHTGIYNIGTLDTAEGNDIITGIGGEYGIENSSTFNTVEGEEYGIEKSSTLNTGEGNDIITAWGEYYGIENTGTLNTGEGNDIITASARDSAFVNTGTFNTADGNDVIESSSGRDIGNSISITQGSIFDTGNGNDRISGGGGDTGISNASFTFNTGDGNDTIEGGAGANGIKNKGLINTGNGKDTIIAQASGESFFQGFETLYAGLSNFSTIDTGEGEDVITVSGNIKNGVAIRALENFGFIGTGDGNDIITSIGVIDNEGVINMGDGNDSIIANEGFESGFNSSGAWFLGEGEDYIKGFGSGDFYGGNGNDTLELTPGTYTVGIWGEGGESTIFTKGNQLMITSEFEKLKVGNTLYDFTNLTAGQIITVA
jgi:hypothetical protein